MTCKTAQSKLSAYLDGELCGFDMLDMRSHLHSCTKCTEESDQMRRLKSMLGSMKETTPDEEFAARLKQAVFAEMHPLKARRVPLAMVSGMAFVAALLVSLAALKAHNPPITAHAQAKQQVAQSNFDLSRDQAWQSGADSLSDGSFIITASTNASH